jgi:hypothetical protein
MDQFSLSTISLTSRTGENTTNRYEGFGGNRTYVQSPCGFSIESDDEVFYMTNGSVQI